MPAWNCWLVVWNRQSLIRLVLISHVRPTRTAGVRVFVVVRRNDVKNKLATTMEVVAGMVPLTSLALTYKDRITKTAGAKAYVDAVAIDAGGKLVTT